jgi:hypothetical protein
MKPDAYKHVSRYRVRQGPMASEDDIGNNGAFMLPILKRGDGTVLIDTVGPESFVLGLIVSDGEGWDHVSVSLPNRCPTWAEMCLIKDLLFEKEETVMQLHPPRSQYVNCHSYCLHLWRPQNRSIPLPPSYMVGPR